MEQANKNSHLRDSNIELLRIVAILGVIVLHYNNESMGGGGFANVEKGSANYFVLYLLETIFICAVDLFVLISGYFMCTSQKRNIVKPIQLMLLVIVFRVLTSSYDWIKNDTFSVRGFINCLIPVNYFVILYITLYFVSPYINIVLKSLCEKQINILIIISIIFFSVWPTMVDVLQQITSIEFMGLSTVGMYGSQSGYTIVNFILMYLIGAYIRVNEMNEKGRNEISLWKLFFFWILIIALILTWSFFNSSTAWEYCNPLVILESIIVFSLFKRINLKSKIVNSLSKATFTTFLIHTFFFKWLHIAEFVNRNVFVMLVHIVVSCVVIYIICYFIWLIYDLITKPIYKFLFKSVKPYSVDLED